MVRAKLAPGFRFHPTDIELVKYYLKRKVMRKKLCVDVIADVNIYKYQPWDLPDKSLEQIGDLKWYFFCPIEKKYASGARMKRATGSGFWKATGKDRPILQNDGVVGMKKTLVFHIGGAPHGERTDWVMHEYRLQDNDLADPQLVKDPYVLCVVFKKNGPGPQNGAQYGAPFNEEDWDGDEGNVCVATFPFTPSAAPVSSVLPVATNDSHTTSAHNTETAEFGFSSLSTLSGVEPDSCNILPSVPGSNVVSGANPAVAAHDDDILSMLACFTEDTTVVVDEIYKAKETDNLGDGGGEIQPCLDPNEIYNGLGDLNEMGQLGGNVSDFPSGYQAAYAVDQVLGQPDMLYLELQDLDSPLPWPAM